MTSDAQTKYGKLRNVISHNIGADQKSESFVYRWLRALIMFDVHVTCFPGSAFV